MKAEYDFAKAARGKYAARVAEGTNIVVIDPDLADLFPDSQSVNEALRGIAGVIRSRAQARPPRRMRRPRVALKR